MLAAIPIHAAALMINASRRGVGGCVGRVMVAIAAAVDTIAAAVVAMLLPPLSQLPSPLQLSHHIAVTAAAMPRNRILLNSIFRRRGADPPKNESGRTRTTSGVRTSRCVSSGNGFCIAAVNPSQHELAISMLISQMQLECSDLARRPPLT
jgi:hypothetical protein